MLPLREQFLDKTDLRLDIALVGSAWIPDALRDIVTRTKGSIMTVTDIDEVGAVVQRLAGQQTQGTWVTIPQQDYFLIDVEQPVFKDSTEPGVKEGTNKDLDVETDGTLFKRLRGNRYPHRVSSKSKDVNQTILRPFYVDPATRYELIVGLTQPLTIAGLSDEPTPLPANGDTGMTRRIPMSTDNLAQFPLPSIRLVPGQVRDPEEILKQEQGNRRNLIGIVKSDLTLNLEKSTPMILVFDLPTETPSGWYNPVLALSGGNFYDATTKDPKADATKKRGLATILRQTATGAATELTTKEQAVTDATTAMKEPNVAKKVPLQAALTAAEGLIEAAKANKLKTETDAQRAETKATSAENAAKSANYGIVPSPTAHHYRNNAIHFTFSVGTQTSKAQMIASLVQDPPSDSTTTNLGTVTGSRAYLSAVLSAGAAVLDADVVGYVQRIDLGTDPIETGMVIFHDDGNAPDKVKDDGIYSATVPLPAQRTNRAEYRVFVEGRSHRNRTRFVPAGEPGLAVAASVQRGDSKDVQADAALPPTDRKAPAFQRATSINFNVPAAGGR